MKEERLAVLDMLAKGTISVDEAERLLKVLQEDDRPRRRPEPRPPRPERQPRREEGNEGLDRFGQKLGRFARKVGDRLEDAANEMEPRIRKTAQTVADKTQDVAWTVADKTHDVVMDIKKGYNDYQADKKQAQTRSYDEPLRDDDFEELPKGSTIVSVDQTPLEGEAKEVPPTDETNARP